jgi:hypothetical protein
VGESNFYSVWNDTRAFRGSTTNFWARRCSKSCDFPAGCRNKDQDPYRNFYDDSTSFTVTYHAVQWSLPTFRKNVLSSSSGSRSKVIHSYRGESPKSHVMHEYDTKDYRCVMFHSENIWCFFSFTGITNCYLWAFSSSELERMPLQPSLVIPLGRGNWNTHVRSPRSIITPQKHKH